MKSQFPPPGQDLKGLLAPLFLADPETAQMVMDIAQRQKSHERIPLWMDGAIWSLSVEQAFGKAFCRGLAWLLDAPEHTFLLYKRLVLQAGREGATLGKIMAENLLLALRAPRPDLAPKLLAAVFASKKWGVHSLERPLKAFALLVESDDLEAAAQYLHLVRVVFSQNMTYHQRLLFSQLLPKQAQSLPRSRRAFQMRAMARAARTDLTCVEPFCDGLEKGVHLLDREALEDFVSQGLARLAQSRDAAMKFFSMESRLGAEAFDSLQVTVSLAQHKLAISRYLRARLGRGAGVQSITPLYGKGVARRTLAVTDGKTIYLPDELGEFSAKDLNTALFKALARLEAGLCEFGTHDFDLGKAVFACRKAGLTFPFPETQAQYTDLFQFFSQFEIFQLARDLFIALEHGRVRHLMLEKYPGLAANAFSLMEDRTRILLERGGAPLSHLYARIALGMDTGQWRPKPGLEAVLGQTNEAFLECMQGAPDVHQSAVLTVRSYGAWIGFLQSHYKALLTQDLAKTCQPMETPFGRTILAGGMSQGSEADRKAAQLMAKLAKMGVYAFRSELKKRMETQQGAITEQDVKDLAMPLPGPDTQQEAPLDKNSRDALDLSSLRESGHLSSQLAQEDNVTDPVFWYREWDHHAQDYLPAYCRVVVRTGPPGHGDFYGEALKAHAGMVKNIRKSFEMLRPQGLAILRRWIEGDAFDHRALIDYAVDRKARRTPSERLYTKRVKQVRDVAALLLVDLSRSTSNLAAGSEKSVLTVEKEAIVLFCEALAAVGDSFAIAGFSGAGRLRVDYLDIKEFGESLTPEVKQRISGMAPSRNTRMGAAIRHATKSLSAAPSKVRLLIILSDGFPNDLEYKGQYSIADTRTAIAEARAASIHVHAITVNLQEAINLDLIYGGVHHNLISDVRELPHKLPRIYRTLTR